MHLTGAGEEPTEVSYNVKSFLVIESKGQTSMCGDTAEGAVRLLLSVPRGVLTMTYHYRKDEGCLTPLLVC